MTKQTIDSLSVVGKRVLMRVDFNVPLGKSHEIEDDTRITESLPSIRKILDDGGRLILMSHLGRPKGKPNPEFSLKPVATRLAELLGKPVEFAGDCIGAEATAMAHDLKNGEVLLLENLRFHAEEEANDAGFAEKLAALGDIFVNDAFGTAHRAHASTEGVTHFIRPAVAGYLIEKELKYLGTAMTTPKRPFVAILGGSKISGKIDVLESLIDKVDVILIGGAMIFTFFKSQGLHTGKSLVEDDKVEVAAAVLKKAKEKNVRLLLPVDLVIAEKMDADAASKTVDADAITGDWMGLDIGEKTIALFSREVAAAQTVVWNGPMGVFEIEKFAKGTMEIAKSLAEATKRGATTIIGGGDSASAISKAGLEKEVTHVSTGGGASLEFLEGKVLPGIAALTDNA
ncbi:MAG: phosphoglycerate kinase [Rhizobacter sp.]|nr:phosphoglycerate kinase [Chlorobiales bacterium]